MLDKIKKFAKTMWQYFLREPNVFSIKLSCFIGFVFGLLYNVVTIQPNPVATLVLAFIYAAFIIYPVCLTIINIRSTLFLPESEELAKKMRRTEYITLVLGIFYSAFYTGMIGIHMDADWDEPIYAYQQHTPIWTEAQPTVYLLAAVGIAGYLILLAVPLKKMPPLAVALCIAAMYIGVGVNVMWIVQVFGCTEKSLPFIFYLILYPFNFCVLSAKRIRLLLCEREEAERLRRLPVLGFYLLWPLLGILILILVLFGQRPDAIVKAWTETADWALSTRQPQWLEYDGHYLCTVAAGGHPQVVKPLRMGQRRGHKIIVNRQLLVANAFEQLLEERTPHFHRCVRHIYDTYGFPVAKLIRTKLAADVVYVLMKPLEWIFLAVLYLFDTKPENRIAVQYLPLKNP